MQVLHQGGCFSWVVTVMSDSQTASEAVAQFAKAVQHGFGFGLNTSVFGARTIIALDGTHVKCYYFK